jgi:hypothetical protein
MGWVLGILCAGLWAQAAEFTFRNGLDNYTGTEDVTLLKNYVT